MSNGAIFVMRWQGEASNVEDGGVVASLLVML